jgi:hypothetical protein
MHTAPSSSGGRRKRCLRKSKRTDISAATASSPHSSEAIAGGEGRAPHAFVLLTFALGEAFQFDWSEEGLVVGGITGACRYRT